MLQAQRQHNDYPSLSAPDAPAASLLRRVCQWMKKITSQSAVVTTASKKFSQANPSERTAAQCRHRSTAGMAAGEVTSAHKASLRRRFFSGKGMAALLGGLAWVASLLAQGTAAVLVAIALCVGASIALVVAYKGTGMKPPRSSRGLMGAALAGESMAQAQTTTAGVTMLQASTAPQGPRSAHERATGGGL